MNIEDLLPSTLVDFLSPPSNEQGLLQVLENLNRIILLTKLPLSLLNVLNKYQISLLIEAVENACSEKNQWRSNYETSVNKILHGSITNHSFWALLNVDNRNSPFILALQTAAIEAVAGDSRFELLNHDLDPFSRLIRYIPESNVSEVILSFQPKLYSELLAAVENLQNYKFNELSDSTIESSLRLVKIINNKHIGRRDNKAHKETTKFIKTPGEQKIHGGVLIVVVKKDEDDPNSPESVDHLILDKKSDYKKSEILEHNEFGMDEYELEPRQETFIQKNGINTARIEAIQKRKQSSAIRSLYAQINAALANNYNILNDHELIQVYQVITNLRTSNKTNDLKFSLALWIMLITASNTDRLEHLIVLEDKSDFDPQRNSIAYIMSDQSWLLPLLLPKYKTEEKQTPASKRKSTENFIDLPDIYNTRGLFLELGIKHGDTPFSEINLRKPLKNTLSNLDERITIDKISRYLLYKAVAKFDPVLTQLMLCTRISSANARQYYSLFSDSEIKNSYLDVNRLLNDKLSIINTKQIKVSHNYFIGARDVPLTSEITSSIRKINDKIHSIARDNIVEFHNWITIKVIFTQGLFTAIRSIRDPFISLNQLSISDTVLTFQDKSTADFHHVRFQPLIPDVKLIAAYYEQHRKYIIKNLSPSQKNELKSLGDTTFILTSDFKIKACSPKTLNPYWNEISDYPIN